MSKCRSLEEGDDEGGLRLVGRAETDLMLARMARLVAMAPLLA